MWDNGLTCCPLNQLVQYFQDDSYCSFALDRHEFAMRLEASAERPFATRCMFGTGSCGWCIRQNQRSYSAARGAIRSFGKTLVVSLCAITICSNCGNHGWAFHRGAIRGKEEFDLVICCPKFYRVDRKVGNVRCNTILHWGSINGPCVRVWFPWHIAIWIYLCFDNNIPEYVSVETQFFIQFLMRKVICNGTIYCRLFSKFLGVLHHAQKPPM